MTEARAVFEAAVAGGVGFFAGVPDSHLAPFCRYVALSAPEGRHLVATSEGGAVALACGHFLGTGELPLVYLQNSGLGNAVNPLLSLADPGVYSIPMVLMVGWRGEPGVPDEAQHRPQGKAMEGMLVAMELPYRILHPQPALPARLAGNAALVAEACAWARDRGGPVVLLVRKGVFSPYAPDDPQPADGDLPPSRGAADNGESHSLTREKAIGLVLDHLPERSAVIATTGMTSRELAEARTARGEVGEGDFLMVGSMGHASQIALGVARARPEHRIYCLDGDGAILMHLGGLALMGTEGTGNLVHIILNNGAHDSVGGQPSVGFRVDFPALALGCGYRAALRVSTEDALGRALEEFRTAEGPVLLEVILKLGTWPGVGRPAGSFLERRDRFMDYLGEGGE